MCLATPVKVTKIDGQKATVDSGNHSHVVDISLIPDVQVGEYILAHGELAINKVVEDEAKRIIAMVSDLNKKERG